MVERRSRAQKTCITA